MNLSICVATMRPFVYDTDDQFSPGSVYHLNGSPGPGDITTATANSVGNVNVHVRYNTPEHNFGVVGSYQKLYEETDEEILCYIHDDVIVRERGWDERVLREFDDPTVGLVGFGGAKWHGTSDLYKVPYVLQHLRRGDYLSNVDDAEVHGDRFTGACNVAVLDGFSLIVRRGVLDRIGGWNRILTGCDFYCYDYALCALVRRLGMRIRVVGIRCHHRGGSTSVAGNVAVAKITSPEAYERSHRWFYDEFRDQMPHDVRHEKA